ncbi:SPOR domain-containing protein [Thermovibrio sp.]
MFKRLGALLIVVALSKLGLSKELKEGVSYYCYQVISSKKITKREVELFKELSLKTEGVRLEKIGPYYTLRVGFWDSRREAEKALKRLNLKGKGGFLRKCYYLPQRWVLPKVKRKKETSVKVKKPTEKRRKKGKGLNLELLISEALKENSLIKAEEVKGLGKVSFPQTRLKKEKDKDLKLKAFVFSSSWGSLSHFSLLNLTYKGIGVGILRRDSCYKVGGVLNFYKEKLIKEEILVKAGVFKEEDRWQNWTPLSLEVSGDYVDKAFNSFISYLPFRNYNDQFDLKGLFSAGFKGKYFLSSQKEVEGGIIYDKFTNNREIPFQTGLRVYGGIYRGENGGELLTKGKNFLLSGKLKVDKVKLSLFYDRKLTLPPESKGEIYLKGRSAFSPLSLYNLEGGKAEYYLGNLKLLGEVYLLRKRGNNFIVGTKVLKGRGKFLGSLIGAEYTKTIKGVKLNVKGALFFPGSAFKEKSPKFSSNLNLNFSW